MKTPVYTTPGIGSLPTEEPAMAMIKPIRMAHIGKKI
jgi:hypothetical protein